MIALQPGEDAAFLLNSLIVVIIGGMGSLGGAAIGALALGLVDSYADVYLVFGDTDLTNYSILLTFALLVIVLAFRPLGLRQVRREGEGQEAVRRPRPGQGRRQDGRDRGLRLLQRHRRQGDRGDPAPDGAGEGRHPHRPAVGRRGHRGRQLREGQPRQDVHQRHVGRAGRDAEGAGAELLPFHSDGAQWAAGLGDYAYNKLGWKTAAVIGDDYSFPYTSLAGFIAEFCAVGGRPPSASGRRSARRTTRRSSPRSRRTSTA